MNPIARRRRRRLIDKLNRAFWRSMARAQGAMLGRNWARADQYAGVADEMHELIGALERGEFL